MEKLQRFSIRKLSIGAVSCIIGTVAFLGYSRDAQAAETPQAVKTETVQENKQNAGAGSNVQNAAINKDAVGSQKTDALTAVNQASSEDNVPATNEAGKTNESLATNKAEINTLIVKPATDNKDSAQADNKQDFPKGDKEVGKNQ